MSAGKICLSLQLRDGTKQEITADVSDKDSGQVNIAQLHKSLLDVQQKTNAMLTKLVEEARETTVNGPQTKQIDEDDEEEDDEEEADEEPPEKIQKR